MVLVTKIKAFFLFFLNKSELVLGRYVHFIARVSGVEFREWVGGTAAHCCVVPQNGGLRDKFVPSEPPPWVRSLQTPNFRRRAFRQRLGVGDPGAGGGGGVAPGGHARPLGRAVPCARMRSALESLARPGAGRWPVSSTPRTLHPAAGRSGLMQKPRFWSDRTFSVLTGAIVSF